MRKNTKFLVHSATIAALYMLLTYLQNTLFPDSASQAIQFRMSEALCVLALVTPAAIPGLTVGCMLFNLCYPALPWDFLIGSAATLLATGTMFLTRSLRIKRFPLLGLTLPALFNGLLVGWELAWVIGGGFWFNAACVAIGELAVLFIPGTILYYTILNRKLLKLFELN